MSLLLKSVYLGLLSISATTGKGNRQSFAARVSRAISTWGKWDALK